MKYQIRVTKNNGDYIILEEKEDFRYINLMYQWYEANAKFFNGQLSIEEV